METLKKISEKERVRKELSRSLFSKVSPDPARGRNVEGSGEVREKERKRVSFLFGHPRSEGEDPISERPAILLKSGGGGWGGGVRGVKRSQTAAPL